MTSLLISTPSRFHLLANSLERLRDLTLPAQLVLVDDASSEPDVLRTETRCFEEDTGVPSVYVRNDQSTGNWAAPCNLGLAHCDQDRVVIACPECYFVSDVLAQLMAFSEGSLTMAGTVYYGEDDRDLERLDQLELSGGGQANAPYVAIVARKHLLKIGGWDERFTGWGGEDIDLMLRLEEIGVGRAWCSDAKVLHQFHGDGGGVEKKMDDAAKNSEILNRKPFTHGAPFHVCSDGCLIARGVKIPRGEK